MIVAITVTVAVAETVTVTVTVVVLCTLIKTAYINPLITDYINAYSLTRFLVRACSGKRNLVPVLLAPCSSDMSCSLICQSLI